MFKQWTQKARRLKQHLYAGLMCLLVGATVLNPIQAQAISSIYLAVVLNPDQMEYQASVLKGDRASVENAIDFSKIGSISGNKFTLSTNSYTSLIGKIPDRSAVKTVLSFTSDNASKFVFVYPKANETDATDTNYYLVGDLNYLIQKIIVYAGDATGGKLPQNSTDRTEVLMHIGAKLAVASNGGGSVTFDVKNDLKFIGTDSNATITLSFSSANEKDIPNISTSNIDESYYQTATLSGGKKTQTHTVLTRIARTLHTLQADSDITASTTGWTEVVAVANALYLNREITLAEYAQVSSPGIVEQHLLEVFDSILGGIRSMIGLRSMDELMFNTGQWGHETWYGIAPARWIDSATVLFAVCQVIAWIVLSGSIITLLLKRNLATINPSVRVSLIEGFKNILITAFCLTFCFYGISLIARLNESLVGVFATGSVYNEVGMSNIIFQSGSWGGIVLNFFFLMAEIYYNAIYILRGVAVCLLIGIAPLMIVGIAYGKITRAFFTNWLKELIGNITIQSFHALFLTFFGLYSSYAGPGSVFEQFVIIIALIPMSKLFKTLTGMGESDFASQAATQAKNTIGTGILLAGVKKASRTGNEYVTKPGTNWAKEKAGNAVNSSRFGPSYQKYNHYRNPKKNDR